MNRIEKNKIQKTIAEIIVLVTETRAKVEHIWVTPDTFCSYLFAMSEIGEFADSAVSGIIDVIRNHPERKRDTLEKEFAQFIIMLVTTLTSGQEDFMSFQYVMSSNITYIITGRGLVNWRIQVEGMLERAIEISESFGLNPVEIVRQETDRLLVKYSSDSNNANVAINSDNRSGDAS